MIYRLIVAFCLCAHVSAAQTAANVEPGSSGSISGVVFDSLSATPIPGAVVQLLAEPDPSVIVASAVTDSIGRFILDSVPGGRYKIGFTHPVLDSLGIEPPLRDVMVRLNRSTRVALGPPSPAAFRRAICRATTDAEASAVLIGTVYDATSGAPLRGASVVAQWLELTFGTGGLSRRVPRLTATSGENGWFAMCNVPPDGTVALAAMRGSDTTSTVDVQISREGFARRDLYVGQRDSLLGRLTGAVVAAATGKLLSGAHVSVVGGPSTATSATGEWAFSNAPMGTRTLEVRALGYYPERLHVNIGRTDRPVRVALMTMKAVLDTIRIRAARVDPKGTGFAQRRRSGVGRYVTADDIAKHPVSQTSDIFRNAPSLKMERNSFGESFVTMRGRSMNRCSPAIYLDGRYLRDLSADAIDEWVKPHEIAGIEIYAEGTVPAQFDMGPIATAVGFVPDPSRLDAQDPDATTTGSTIVVTACGSIVVWTK